MKKINMKFLSLLVCIVFACSFYMTNAFAAQNQEFSNKDIKVLQNDNKIVKISGEYKGDVVYATLDKETKEITLQTVEQPKTKVLGFGIGKNKVTNYRAKVESFENNNLAAVVTDVDSKKRVQI